jgi:ribosomal-protein-serine acetyltransferase
MFRLAVDADLELGLLEARYAPLLFALTDRNRAHLRAWLPWLDSTTTVEDTRGFIDGALQQFAAGKGFQAGIWFRGELAGMIGYHAINWAGRKVELGYWLAADHSGKGIVTRAARALIDYAFAELDLNRVEIRCATDNTRSCAIPQRLGLRHEGVLRQAEWLYDHFVDHHVYSILKDEWQTE